ncbi:MAG TPA: tRNA pseudouridine synthase A, partial [Caulobacteraceae bacterium]|nr:tRNA pseudouridine synthase A [Caulobacteraceae bacterium]
MSRYRLTVEYDGAPYNGFQAQAELPSVQTSLERAITAFSGERAVIFAAGRTDTGVHATGQVVHFDVERDWPASTVMNALNAHLVKESIVVLDAIVAPPDFHARFSAKGRAYLYRILNRGAP